MPRVVFKLEAEFEDGTTEVAEADQRDIAAWELEPFGGPFVEYPRKAMTFFRYMFWHVQKRRGSTVTREDFEARCVEVHDMETDQPEAEDPGPTVASDAPSLPSHGTSGAP